MLHVDRWPDLREPVLVLVTSGWVDAGSAGAGAVAVLLEQLESRARMGALDLADLVDLQQARPTVRLVDGGLREIAWPEIELSAGTAGRDVIVAHGPEPSLRWPVVAAELVDVARRSGVSYAVTLGGMPALVSHRRPLQVLATAVSRSLAQEVEPVRPDYEGPTGFQTIVQHELGRAGIPAVGLWAQVPQYVSGSASPAAVRALLARLVEITGVSLDLRPLDGPSDEWVEKIDEGLRARPDVAGIVEQLEQAEAEDLPSGDELASEIERFLRSRPDEP